MKRTSYTSDGNLAKKISRIDLYKPPTTEELQMANSTSLYRSNLFDMQIQELFQEVYIKESRKKLIDSYLTQLVNVINKVPSGMKTKITDQEWLRDSHVCVPISQNPYYVKGNFQYLPPKSVKVIGSYAIGTAVKPKPCIDLTMEIPNEFFDSKDHLNHRYLRKRALYLAYLASQLKEDKLISSLNYSLEGGNKLKPILVIRPTGLAGKEFFIHLHVNIEKGAFKLNRFHISKNNVRMEWFYGESSKDTSEQPSTPVYNTSILCDAMMLQHSKLLQSLVSDSTNIRDGLTLLKVWLRQRELDEGFGCFSNFVLSMYVLYLMKHEKLNFTMTSFQVFKNTLLNLANEDWSVNGISLCQETDLRKPTMQQFHQAFEVVFIDNTGFINLSALMTKEVFYWVKLEAGKAVKILGQTRSFELLFMTPVPFVRQFDSYIHIHKLDRLKDIVNKFIITERMLDYGGDYIAASLSSVSNLIWKALGTRLEALAICPIVISEWNVTTTADSLPYSDLSFGLRVHFDHSSSILIKGPIADNKKAAEFRAFWGNKSELRRYQDGSICESVVWSAASMKLRRVLPFNIIQYVLNRHAGIPSDCTTFSAVNLDSMLSLPINGYGSGEEEHQAINRRFDELVCMLKNHSDLPLMFTAIQGIDPVFRYSEVFPALPVLSLKKDLSHKLDNMLPSVSRPSVWVPTMKVLCTLESSGKWPENPSAVYRLKAAYMIQLAKHLNDQKHVVAQAQVSHVNVLKDGFVFNLYLVCPQEFSLLNTVANPGGHQPDELEQEICVLPKLCSALHSIQQTNESYSSAVRLAKLWVSSQLLLSQISEVTIEQLVAYLYISPLPYSVPKTPVAGFVRFLHMLSSHDWQLLPVIINFNGIFSEEDNTEIYRKFDSSDQRKSFMCLISPYDLTGYLWTSKQPNSTTLRRLVLLAKESLVIIQNHISSPLTDYQVIFQPPLEVYDVIIHLRQKHNVCHRDCVKHVNCDTANETFRIPGLPVLNFNPVQKYLQELREACGDVAIFFHNKYGGTIIAVLWRPVHQTTSLHTSQMSFTTKNVLNMIPNMAAIIEDFKVIGQGVVDRIEILTKCE